MPQFRPVYPSMDNNNNNTFSQQDKLLADRQWKTFESTLPCAGKTPLGRAIPCAPVPGSMTMHARYCDYWNGTRCHIVYAGHNNLGSEWHWLPNHYLIQWWKNTKWYQQSNNFDHSILEKLQQRSQKWTLPEESTAESTNPCSFQPRSSLGNNSLVSAARRFYKQMYYECIAPEEETADQAVIRAMKQIRLAPTNDTIQDWSILHASLPLLRVVLLREPFSWLVSKYFWH